MSAQEIASILGNAKKVGGGYLASCPVPSHGQGNGDKNPSLSITMSDDGNPLFKCHGGCDQHTVFSTIKEMGLLPALPDRPDYLDSIKPMKPIPLISTPVLEHEWHYTDEEGISLFIKQRFKTFDSKGKTYKTLRVMPDGTRVGKLGDCRIVPYKLPDLQQATAAGRVVYITEGEKAADALGSLGVVATTSHAGAGNWNPELNQYFAGANVVVVPDNDISGWQYAQKVVEALIPTAKSVRVLDLNLSNPKEDAYEWVTKYEGDRQNLALMAKACLVVTSLSDVQTPQRLQETAETPQESEEPPKSKFLVESWDSIKDEPVEWLIQDILPKKAFCALFAPPASWKSFLALDMAEAIATGRDWMGCRIPQKGAVLIIAGEGHGGLGARVKACKIQNNSPDGANLYVIRSQINLRSSPEEFEALINSINDLIAQIDEPLQLVILDTLMRMSGGNFNENSSEDMGAVITQIGRIQSIFSCAIMVIHHSGKDVTRGLRGHSSLLGAVDTELEINRLDSVINSADPSVKGSGTITTTKQKDGSDSIVIGFEVVLIEVGTSDLGFETITSLAVRQNQDVAKSNPKGSKNNNGSGNNQRIELDSLYKAIKAKGSYRAVDGSSRFGVSLDDWKDEFWSMKGCTEDDRTAFKKAWLRARERLVAVNKVTIGSNWVWLKSTIDFSTGDKGDKDVYIYSDK
jgi:hypothetical protein